MKLPQTIMVLDTETIGLQKPFVYDVGYIVAELVNGKYKPVMKQQVLITEIYDNRPLFATAYYNGKRPLYESLLKGGKLEKLSLSATMERLSKVIDYYNVEGIFAYNSSFDNRAFNFTTKFFNIENTLLQVNWYDIQKIANIIHQTPEYIDFCGENGFIGESGYIQTNAERTHAFNIGNAEYVEPHMALQDCEIELDIINVAIDYGVNNFDNITSKRFIVGNSIQTLVIEHNGEIIELDYNKRINREKGQRIVLS